MAVDKFRQITTSEHIGSVVNMQYYLYQQTGDMDYVRALRNTMLEAGPNHKYCMQTSTEGVASFMDVDVPLTHEKSQQLIDELQVCPCDCTQGWP